MCSPSPQDDPWLSNITSRLYKSFTSSWNTKKNISQFNNEVWFIWSADDNKQTDYLCWWVASWTISGNNLEKIRLWQDSNLCLPNTNWTLLPTEISQVGSKAYLEDSSFPWLKWYLSWKISLTWISHLDSIFFLQIQIIPENSFVIRNLEENRVRIFVDRQQTVTRTPHIGWQKDFFFQSAIVSQCEPGISNHT